MISDRLAWTGPLRNRSPWEKLLFSLGLMAEAMLLPPPAPLLVLALTSLAAVVAARIPLRTWLALLAAPAGFLLAGTSAMAVGLGPDGPFLDPAGLWTGLAACLRSLGAISCLLFLGLTMPLADLLEVLRRLGLPTAFTDLALVVHRFLFSLLDTARAMHLAQAARLGHASAASSIRSAAILSANLFTRAAERAARLEAGLEARGYDGRLLFLQDLPAASALTMGALASLLVVLAVLAGALR